MELIRLKGSQKQIDWAENIRDNLLIALEAGEKIVNNKFNKLRQMRIKKGVYNKEEDEIKIEGFINQYKAVQEYIKNIEEAKEFIEELAKIQGDTSTHICENFDMLFSYYTCKTGNEISNKIKNLFKLRNLMSI